MTATGFRKALEAAREQVLKAATTRVPDTKHARNLAKRFRKHGEAYFRFITTPGIEPTNNLAEQAIRFVVIDRRITQGTRSEKGRRWCERIWTVIATCAQQGRAGLSVLAGLGSSSSVRCCSALTPAVRPLTPFSPLLFLASRLRLCDHTLLHRERLRKWLAIAQPLPLGEGQGVVESGTLQTPTLEAAHRARQCQRVVIGPTVPEGLLHGVEEVLPVEECNCPPNERFNGQRAPSSRRLSHQEKQNPAGGISAGPAGGRCCFYYRSGDDPGQVSPNRSVPSPFGRGAG